MLVLAGTKIPAINILRNRSTLSAYVVKYRRVLLREIPGRGLGKAEPAHTSVFTEFDQNAVRIVSGPIEPETGLIPVLTPPEKVNFPYKCMRLRIHIILGHNAGCQG